MRILDNLGEILLIMSSSQTTFLNTILFWVLKTILFTFIFILSHIYSVINGHLKQILNNQVYSNTYVMFFLLLKTDNFLT